MLLEAHFLNRLYFVSQGPRLWIVCRDYVLQVLRRIHIHMQHGLALFFISVSVFLSYKTGKDNLNTNTIIM
jgi:hypothetical protein